MRSITETELKKIIENHLHYLNQDCEGWAELKADLSYTNLCGVNLCGVNLCGADLHSADLSLVNLYGANLGGADLRLANLYSADLGHADLYGADLSIANLRGANLNYAILTYTILRGANLNYANLYSADLGYAILRGVDLNCANLDNANLSYVNLRGADLRGTTLRGTNLSCTAFNGADLCLADLRGAVNIPYIPLACPSDGSFVGWKKIDDKLIKLEIPADARIVSATTNKCRCDKAKVLGIYELDGTPATKKEITNTYYIPHITYKVGEMVYPDSFDDNRWNECSNGIHFFIDKRDAMNY